MSERTRKLTTDTETTIGELTPDPKNVRRHTPRNVGAIVSTLGRVGAARSIVIDDHGVILAGNATYEAACEAGIERVRVIDADGQTLIAVRRTGLTAKQKADLAISDNRTAEFAEWDVPNLIGLAADVGLDLTTVEFTPEEIEKLGDEFVPAESPAEFPEVDEDIETQHCCPKCGYRWSGKSGE